MTWVLVFTFVTALDVSEFRVGAYPGMDDCFVAREELREALKGYIDRREISPTQLGCKPLLMETREA